MIRTSSLLLLTAYYLALQSRKFSKSYGMDQSKTTFFPFGAAPTLAASFSFCFCFATQLGCIPANSSPAAFFGFATSALATPGTYAGFFDGGGPMPGTYSGRSESAAPP